MVSTGSQAITRICTAGRAAMNSATVSGRNCMFRLSTVVMVTEPLTTPRSLSMISVQPGEILQGGACVAQHQLPGIGEPHAVRSPFEQCRAEVVLELQDLPIDGRRRDMKPLGGSANRAVLGDRGGSIVAPLACIDSQQLRSPIQPCRGEFGCSRTKDWSALVGPGSRSNHSAIRDRLTTDKAGPSWAVQHVCPQSASVTAPHRRVPPHGETQTGQLVSHT